MRTVKLYGRLGRELGKEFKLHVNSVTDVVRALNANFPKALQIIADGDYRIVCGSKTKGLGIDKDTLELNLPPGAIHIMPVAKGNKNGGTAKVIAGVALIAVSLAAGPVFGAAVAAGTWGATLTGAAFSVGIGLTLTGVSQMLTGTPKMPGMENFERENTPSFLLGGSVNAVNQGNPVPICFGTHRIGGVVVSGGISTEDIQKPATA